MLKEREKAEKQKFSDEELFYVLLSRIIGLGYMWAPSNYQDYLYFDLTLMTFYSLASWYSCYLTILLRNEHRYFATYQQFAYV